MPYEKQRYLKRGVFFQPPYYKGGMAVLRKSLCCREKEMVFLD
ncbi:hypothetical protein B4096_2654 [Heyndrickxia coagulans]|uniref:Uncharacterized protein n=1 Tax=Heyndrickxia coagulans TaxID=1398 RepID=A0AAN0WBQ8_HEYCO|nr:hypothetical protein SB48_HM08orf02866 [Heyndrickxia coagulans]KYC91699.1 hypothetical protein B4096_2654 [Heyndrickxia coagulans]